MNTAVIGCGYWGLNFVRILSHFRGSLLQTDGGQVLKSVCDSDPSRLRLLEESYPNLQTTTNYADIVKDPSISAVVVVTPAATHFEMVRDLLEAGKHILCEKPLTSSLAQALKLSGMARERGLVLMVSHTFLFHDSIRYIQNHLQEGHLGKILYADFVRTGLGPIRQDVNALWDLAPHDLSIILHLLGRDPDSISAFGQHYIQKKVEDVVFLILEFGDGVMVQMHFSWLNPCKVRQMTLVGTRQMILFDDVSLHEKVKIFDKGISYQPTSGDFGEFQLAIRDGGISIPHIRNREPLANEVGHFLDCVAKGATSLADGENGCRVVRILEAAQKSLDNGNIKVAIPSVLSIYSPSLDGRELYFSPPSMGGD